MKFAKTLLAAAAVIALTAPSYAQVTPGGAGERKANEAPPTTASGTAPMAQPQASKKMKSGTTGAAAGAPGNPETSGAHGARKANEAPGAGK